MPLLLFLLATISFYGCKKPQNTLKGEVSTPSAQAVDNIKGGYNELHYAVFDDKINEIKELASKIDVNAKDVDKDYGCAPLHYAARHGRRELVEELIEAGANTNEQDNKKRIPLHHASYSGNAEIINTLIEGGSEVNALDQYNRAPLHYAAYKGRSEAIITLLNVDGLKVDALDQYGCSALDYAAFSGDFPTIKVLITQGGLKDAQDNHAGRRTALHHTAFNGDWDATLARVSKMEESCLTATEVAQADNLEMKGLDALWREARKYRTKAIEVLITQGGPKVDARDKNGCTPLHYAAHQGNIAATEAYLKNNINIVKHVDKDGNTALHYVIFGKRDGILWRSNIASKEVSGAKIWPVVHPMKSDEVMRAEGGNIYHDNFCEVTRLLIDSNKKVDINAISQGQKSTTAQQLTTVLNLAANLRYTDIVAVFLEQYAYEDSEILHVLRSGDESLNREKKFREYMRVPNYEKAASQYINAYHESKPSKEHKETPH